MRWTTSCSASQLRADRRRYAVRSERGRQDLFADLAGPADIRLEIDAVLGSRLPRASGEGSHRRAEHVDTVAREKRWPEQDTQLLSEAWIVDALQTIEPFRDSLFPTYEVDDGQHQHQRAERDASDQQSMASEGVLRIVPFRVYRVPTGRCIGRLGGCVASSCPKRLLQD